jgi:predicted phosphodiesterase
MKRWARAAFAALPVLLLVALSVGAADSPPSVAALGADRMPAENSQAPLQFAILGDRTGGHRPGVFGQAVQRANLLGPDFVMSIGDYIEGNTEDEAVLQAQWDEFLAIAGRMEAPFFFVPGNHDIFDAASAKIWRERLGSAYYHFVHRGVLFLCLSTEDPPRGHMSAEQADYVARTLAENRDVRWTLVFMHQPLWRNEEKAGKEGKDAATGWPAVEALLADRPYTLFAGHAHTYTHEVREGHEYIVVATCGGASSLGGPASGQFDHITWVTMTDHGPRIAVLPLDGIYDKRGKPEEPPAEALPPERDRGRLQPAEQEREPVGLESGAAEPEASAPAGTFERQ